MNTPRAHCPWEDQLGKTLAVHQAPGAVFLGADKFGAGAAGLGLGVAGNVQARGVFRDLGTDFAFKTRAAVHKRVFIDSPGDPTDLRYRNVCHENAR